MSLLQDGITNPAERERLESIARAMENGEPPADASPEQIVVAVALAGLGDSLGPPLVQAPAHRPGLRTFAGEPFLATIFPKVSRADRLAIAAGLLQGLDFWHESHEAAQESGDLGESAFSPYWHAIAHRREPDPGNAAYWFRRIGHHPIFEPLGKWVAQAHPEVLRGSSWDPTAFIRFCGDAERDPKKTPIARAIQRAEMVMLLERQIQDLS